MLARYKPEQGRMVRMAAYWTCAALVLFGATSLHTLLVSQFDGLASTIGGIRIPIIGADLTGALLISIALVATLMLVLFRWQNTPKAADLLIDTEAELKKVSWPTLNEVINSSVVVIVFVLILMGYLAGTDWLLGRVFTRILLG